jgi:hypothetical protein
MSVYGQLRFYDVYVVLYEKQQFKNGDMCAIPLISDIAYDLISK